MCNESELSLDQQAECSSYAPGNSSIANVTWNGTTAYLNFVGYGSTTVDSTAHDCVYQYNFDTGQCDCTVTPLPVQPQIEARSRQTKWAVLIYQNSTQNLCPSGTAAELDRSYKAYDDFGRIDLLQFWRLNETVTSQSNCNVTTGGSVISDSFMDGIANCTANCTFTST